MNNSNNFSQINNKQTIDRIMWAIHTEQFTRSFFIALSGGPNYKCYFPFLFSLICCYCKRDYNSNSVKIISTQSKWNISRAKKNVWIWDLLFLNFSLPLLLPQAINNCYLYVYTNSVSKTQYCVIYHKNTILITRKSE